MSDSARTPEMTEAERLEFNRRTDVALAVLPIASGLFEARKLVSEALSAKEKGTSLYWFGGLFFVGIALNYYLADEANRFTWALYISFMASLYWVSHHVDVYQLQANRNRCNDQLKALEMTWSSATADSRFWAIEGLEVIYKIDWEDDAFSVWWADSREAIVLRVCEYEKGRAIAEDMRRGDESAREFVQRLHANGAVS